MEGLECYIKHRVSLFRTIQFQELIVYFLLCLAPHPAGFSSAPSYIQTGVPATVGQAPFPQSHSPHPMGTPSQMHPQAMATVGAANNLFSTPPRPSQPTMQPQQHTQTPPQPVQVAQSPQAAAREKARVSILLEINSILIQEVVNLQAAGKAGVPPNQATSQQSSPTQESNTASPTTTDFQNTQNQGQNSDSSKNVPGSGGKPSPEYVECMRRLQANLAYLATVADKGKKPGTATPQIPAIMTPPPNISSVNNMYVRLNDLFPGAVKGPPITPQKQNLVPQPSPYGNEGPMLEASG